MEVAEEKIVEWHHWLTGHEFEQTLGDGERQGQGQELQACCSPWGTNLRKAGEGKRVEEEKISEKSTWGYGVQLERRRSFQKLS